MSEINLAVKYYESVLRNKPLAETEDLYWKYRHHIEYLKQNNLPFKKKLLKSMVLLRKNYLEEKCRI